MKPHYLKLGIGALVGLFAVSACKKDKDNKPGKPDHLISAIYRDGALLDSFAYNDKRQLTQLFHSDDGHVQFEYDGSGRCVRVKYYELGTTLTGKDTLVYSGRDFTIYTEDDDEPFELDNGRAYMVGNDGITLAGSKDTVVSSTGRKRVNYIETTYGGGNPLTNKTVDYLAIPTAGYVSSQTTMLTYRYDNKPNGLCWIFQHNPYAGYLLNHVIFASPVFSGGKNNLTGFKYEDVTTSYTDVLDYVAVNTYDPASGFLAAQEIKAGNSVETSLTYHYRVAE